MTQYLRRFFVILLAVLVLAVAASALVALTLLAISGWPITAFVLFVLGFSGLLALVPDHE